jgi:hypothetical protein
MTHTRQGRLSEAARAWERDQVRALGLEEVDWDPQVECRSCREGHTGGEEPASGVSQTDGDEDAGAGSFAETVILFSYFWQP